MKGGRGNQKSNTVIDYCASKSAVTAARYGLRIAPLFINPLVNTCIAFPPGVFSKYWISAPPPSLHFCTPLPFSIRRAQPPSLLYKQRRSAP